MAETKELTVSCKCGEKKIPIKDFINKHGFVEVNSNWQCPKCWNIVEFYVKETE